MKIFFRLFIFSFFLSFFFISAQQGKVFAVPYGNCAYGQGSYNNGYCGSGFSPSSVNSSSNSTCTATPPSSAPDLFEIDTTDTTATLYIAPAGKPYNNYGFSYGTKSTADMYGGGFNLENATGVISFSIQSLSPHTTYYFKIHAGNSCASGPSSAVVMAKTTNTKGQKGKYYKNSISAFTSTISSVFKQDAPSTAKKIPPQTASEIISPKTSSKNVPLPKISPQKNNQASIFFGSIITGIGHLFGK